MDKDLNDNYFMTDQEAFDIMVEHLANLKKRSTKNISGVYNGSKCAIDILMTDEEQEKFGGFSGGVERLLSEMERFGHTSSMHFLKLSMLEDMQAVHDGVCNWNYVGFTSWDSVKKVAKRYGLEYKGSK